MTFKNYPSKNLVTGKEISEFFPTSDLALCEFEDISQTLSLLLLEAQAKLEQEARKHKYHENLQAIKKHLNEASKYMQIIKSAKGQDIHYLPTNETKDIGITFDDWVNVQGIINRLEEAEPVSTKKALKQKIYSELFYSVHATLRSIGDKINWAGRGELTIFEQIIHLSLKKIGVTVVTDKNSKFSKDDIPEETIKNYIKLSEKKYNHHKKRKNLTILGKK